MFLFECTILMQEYISLGSLCALIDFSWTVFLKYVIGLTPCHSIRARNLLAASYLPSSGINLSMINFTFVKTFQETFLEFMGGQHARSKVQEFFHRYHQCQKSSHTPSYIESNMVAIFSAEVFHHFLCAGMSD